MVFAEKELLHFDFKRLEGKMEKARIFAKNGENQREAGVFIS
jgi:hypothetical protein